MLKRKISQLLVVLVTIVTLLLPTQTISAQAIPDNYRQEQLNLDVKSALAIDSSTGQLLYGKNINEPLPIASMTKLITAYLTLKAIDDKKITWNTEVQPTEQIVKVANNRLFSNVPLKMNHSYTIKQLYQATLIESANGAAMLLAQAISGSQKAFVKQMRLQVEQWGIKDAKLYTACGLPNKSVGSDAYPGAEKNAENLMSAKDMAVVGQHLLNEYPEIIKTTRIAHLDFVDQATKTPMTNFNWMLKGLSQHSSNFNIDGLKTGTTDAAGACFIGTAKHQGARVITVVMGAKHINSADPARFEQTKKLLSFVYQKYQPIKLNKDQAIIGSTNVNVHNGKSKQVNISLKKQAIIWRPVDETFSVGLTKKTVEAPITMGQTVSSYYFKSGNSKLFSLKQPNGIMLPAQAQTSTDRVNIFIRFWHWLFGG
ncbi:D-alanyl-D-alanine carboxypeptidase [Lactobacillus sp. M0403]|uniref:serine hydrolase n=1 Tax=Lactobacillus sp. M0403 TaxID=2751031 RepID=UPI0018DE052D|nr:D-alanyl-D-alanine carboxypeptidase [Lactobacillus sp. M0403]